MMSKVTSLVLLILMALTGSAFAQHEQAFPFNFNDGSDPQGDLISDAAGNLYGTTTYGGNGACDDERGHLGCGTVFEMSPPVPPNGQWTLKTLHSFDINVDDVAYPIGNLVFDSMGNLYGVSSGGGAYFEGAVFELSPQSGGSWNLALLFSFTCGTCNPQGGLVIDSTGNLYGTALGEGDCGRVQCGAIYEVSQSGGQWLLQDLYVFEGGEDGAAPIGSVTFDSQGNLYGTTTSAAAFGFGGVFRLSPPSMQGQLWTETTPPPLQGQPWTETTLHSFGSVSNDGTSPKAGVSVGPNGTLVGTTSEGGIKSDSCVLGCGTVFGLIPPSTSGGQWGYKILYSFRATSTDGALPYSNLTLLSSKSGTVAYGTTFTGGAFNAGTIFEVTQSGPGTWTETPIYNFTGGRDGGYPMSGLLLNGPALYGTTFSGGIDNKNCASGCGTVFRLSR